MLRMRHGSPVSIRDITRNQMGAACRRSFQIIIRDETDAHLPVHGAKLLWGRQSRLSQFCRSVSI